MPPLFLLEKIKKKSIKRLDKVYNVNYNKYRKEVRYEKEKNEDKETNNKVIFHHLHFRSYYREGVNSLYRNHTIIKYERQEENKNHS